MSFIYNYKNKNDFSKQTVKTFWKEEIAIVFP